MNRPVCSRGGVRRRTGVLPNRGGFMGGMGRIGRMGRIPPILAARRHLNPQPRRPRYDSRVWAAGPSVGISVGSRGIVRRLTLAATISRSPESAAAGRRGQGNGAPGGDGNPEGSGGAHSRRNGPGLLPGRYSRRSCGLAVADAARGAGVLLAKRSGTGPVAVRGGS